MKSRLLEPIWLPPSLWDPDQKLLYLPPALAEAYRKLIHRHGLWELAQVRDRKDPPVGGGDTTRTNQHFAQAFDGSVARAQLSILDPQGKVSPASDALIRTLSGNDVVITDAPCGAGAAALAFLEAIADLRARNILPRHPLQIRLIGAELSEQARIFAQELLCEVRHSLEEQAIFVDEQLLSWDVTCQLSNTTLIQRMILASSGTARRLLVVSNFNAVLEKENKRKAAQPQLEELFRHASGPGSVAVWIEPLMNRATGPGGLFPAILKWVKETWHRFSRVNTEHSGHEPFLTASSSFQ